MNSDATLTRTVVDAGIELDITLPESWIEVPVVAASSLWSGVPTRTRRSTPNLLVMVDDALEAEEAFTTVRSALSGLPEARLGFE